MHLFTPEQQPEPITLGERRIVPLIDAAGDVPVDKLLFSHLAPDDLARLSDDGDLPGASPSMVVQGFAILGAGRTILVDTCLGGSKQGPRGPFPGFTSQWMTTLKSAGIDPDAVDTVINTHLHHDHVGWNTTDDLRPTFPSARYLISQAEYQHFASGRIQHAERVAACVTPVERAGLLDLIAGDHRIDDNVTIRPAPGHTPGHLMVQVADAGRTAMIAGDLLHHPAQLRHPSVSTALCAHTEEAAATRRQILGELADRDGLLLATHIARGGTVRRHGVGFAFRDLLS